MRINVVPLIHAMYTVTVLYGKPTPHPLAHVTDDIDVAADAYVVEPGCPHAKLLSGDDVYESVSEAVGALVADKVNLVTAAHDACYSKVKASYNTFPSARASQAIAKCRKSKGAVRKTKAGRNLKRWQREKWKDKITGKPCGHKGGPEYCRPTKKVSKDTPKMHSGKTLQEKINKKKKNGT